MKNIHANCAFCGNPVVRKKQAASANVRRHFCDQECKANHQRQAKPVSREWLMTRYAEEGLDCVQIGKLVSRDPKTVWTWLKDFGIQTRPRGGKTGGKPFQKGHRLGVGRKHTPETRRRLREIATADGRRPYKKEVGPPCKRGSESPTWKGGITPDRQAFYATGEWKTAERAVKKRDRNTCQRCGKVKARGDGQQFDVHHIVSFACVALRAVVSNLVYLCEPCHYWVHSNDNTQGRFILPCP